MSRGADLPRGAGRQGSQRRRGSRPSAGPLRGEDARRPPGAGRPAALRVQSRLLTTAGGQRRRPSAGTRHPVRPRRAGTAHGTQRPTAGTRTRAGGHQRARPAITRVRLAVGQPRPRLASATPVRRRARGAGVPPSRPRGAAAVPIRPLSSDERCGYDFGRTPVRGDHKACAATGAGYAVPHNCIWCAICNHTNLETALVLSYELLQ